MFNGIANNRLIDTAEVKSRSFGITLQVYELSEALDGGYISSDGEQEHFKVPQVPQKRKAASRVAQPVRAKTYSSNWNPDSGAAKTVVEYDLYHFRKTEIQIDHQGNVQEVEGGEGDVIEVASNWRNEIGDVPKGGYIAKGYTKYAFLGRYRETKYAIFQTKENRTTSAENEADLKAELQLLAFGDYFLKSFRRRVECSDSIKSPMADIRWNYEGAFLGKVVYLSDSLTSHLEKASLVYETFLAVPFLERTAHLHEERKFSGAREAGANPDVLGRWMDAYAHHVLLDSMGYIVLTDLQGLVCPTNKLVLFDPQGHTRDASIGPWDQGVQGINEFRSQHKCKTLCKNLGLRDEEKDWKEKAAAEKEKEAQGPLRHGFPSPNKV
ncbi:kinase-like domain-containing protein [Coprinopsis sp. MPI-PUGE-AT-0042]|nr:kinase-like domain-containing protein [Coprinopsis sp. MPI-PUGE-AT-0042]